VIVARAPFAATAFAQSLGAATTCRYHSPQRPAARNRRTQATGTRSRRSMAAPTTPPATRPGWSFPPTFWYASAAELFERAAYYGMFIALGMYLTSVGFTDIQGGYLAGCFSSILYLLPMFMGALADRIGFRRALILAFILLTLGYLMLGAFPSKLPVIASLIVIMLGGAMVKPVISGTAAKCSTEFNRARAFSIYYLVVNIGAFTGKTIARPLRVGFDVPFTNVHLVLGLRYINYYAAAMAFCALVTVILLYRDVEKAGTAKSMRDVLGGLVKVVRNVRFMALIVIVAGFWTIQGQLYASMPKYMLRVVSPHAAPEWLANINPFVVVLCVVPITHLVRHFKPANSIGLALLIIPLSALSIALSPVLQASFGRQVPVFGLTLHPITFMAIIGIALMGLAECFLSPKFMEFASKQAPPGEVGLYMGYQSLSSFFAWLFGWISAGYLLDAYCPDPAKLPAAAYAQWQAATATQPSAVLPEQYAHAHYLWYAYAVVGATAFVALLVFKLITDHIDRQRARTAVGR
jgi:dipeptide/tripeptide permease